MNKVKKTKKAVDFQEYLNEQLKDPEFKRYYDEYGKQLEIAYQILKLRKQKGISQAELARKVGTKQSNIARMEAGQQNFRLIPWGKLLPSSNESLRLNLSDSSDP